MSLNDRIRRALGSVFKPSVTPEARVNPLENPATPLAQGMDYLMHLMGGEPTAAGEEVSVARSFGIATVWACVNCISRDMGSLPLYLYEQEGNGRKKAVDHDLYDLLAVAPNEEMTAPSFFSALIANLVITGNGYAEIVRNYGGQPVELIPRLSQKTKALRVNGELAYQTTDGTVAGQPRTIASSDMLHIPGLGLDGIVGMDPTRRLANALGMALAAEKAAGRLFGNGILSTGILTFPHGMTNEQRINLKESFEKSYTGANQYRPIVVPADGKYTPLNIDPDKAQFLESRQAICEEICRIFGVPPHKAGILARATNNNIEHQGIEYVTSTLRPLAVRVEAEIARKLLPRLGRKANKYFVRFDMSEQLRGDTASQAAYYASGRQWGHLSINDILLDQGRNPIGPEGDVRLAPMNMVNIVSLVVKPGDPAAKPDVDPDQPEDTAQPDSSLGEDDEAGQEDQGSNQSRTMEFYLAAFGRAYSALFSDALGRVLARDKRDFDTLHRAFRPALGIIADEVIRQAASELRVALDNLDPSRLLADHVRAMEKRAPGWTLEAAAETAATELRKAVKAIVYGIYRDAATAKLN